MGSSAVSFYDLLRRGLHRLGFLSSTSISEDYYQAMAKGIEKRFTNWQGQDFDEDTLEPSNTARAIMEYLDCECTYFPSMKDDNPIMAAYG